MILWTTGSSRLIQASSSANARVHSSRRTTKQSSRNREDDDATGKSKLEGVIRPVPGGRSKDEGATPRGPRVKKGNPSNGRFLVGSRRESAGLVLSKVTENLYREEDGGRL